MFDHKLIDLNPFNAMFIWTEIVVCLIVSSGLVLNQTNNASLKLDFGDLKKFCPTVEVYVLCVPERIALLCHTLESAL